MTRRYVIVGAGAVGAVVAAGLADAGIDAVLVSRGATLDAVRERGLRLTRGDRTRIVPTDVVAADELALTSRDVLVFTVKTQDAAAGIADWASRSLADTRRTAGEVLPIVLLENGLEAERAALRHFDDVLAATTLVAAVHVETAHVVHHNEPRNGQLVLGPYPSATLAPRAAAITADIATDLRAGGWVVTETDEPARFLAWKTAVAAAFGVAVLAGTDDEHAALRADIQAEARSVLNAAGFDLADPSTELTADPALTRVTGDYGSGRQSVWQSFARGSGSETDHLNGEIALQARLHGLAAPLNAALQRVLAAAAPSGSDVQASVADVRASAERHEVAAVTA